MRLVRIELQETYYQEKKLNRLRQLQLQDILRRKNPYLFRAKNVLSAEQLVRSFMEAHLSSNEETIFGDFLEGLAIHVSKETCEGHKSSAEGIDLEFEKEAVKYLATSR